MPSESSGIASKIHCIAVCPTGNTWLLRGTNNFLIESTLQKFTVKREVEFKLKLYYDCSDNEIIFDDNTESSKFVLNVSKEVKISTYDSFKQLSYFLMDKTIVF